MISALPVHCQERFRNFAPFANTCAKCWGDNFRLGGHFESHFGCLSGRFLGGVLEVALRASWRSTWGLLELNLGSCSGLLGGQCLHPKQIRGRFPKRGINLH